MTALVGLLVAVLVVELLEVAAVALVGVGYLLVTAISGAVSDHLDAEWSST